MWCLLPLVGPNGAGCLGTVGTCGRFGTPAVLPVVSPVVLSSELCTRCSGCTSFLLSLPTSGVNSSIPHHYFQFSERARAAL